MLIPKPAPRLIGNLVILEQLDISVLQPYVELIGDQETRFWTASSGEYSLEQLSNWLETRPNAEDRLDWAVLETCSGEFAGEIVLNELDPVDNSMNLRIALLSSKTSRGLGSEAIALVASYALSQLQLRAVTLEVLESNLRAIRSYEKSGFVKAGVLEEDGNQFLKMRKTFQEAE